MVMLAEYSFPSDRTNKKGIVENTPTSSAEVIQNTLFLTWLDKLI